MKKGWLPKQTPWCMHSKFFLIVKHDRATARRSRDRVNASKEVSKVIESQQPTVALSCHFFNSINQKCTSNLSACTLYKPAHCLPSRAKSNQSSYLSRTSHLKCFVCFCCRCSINLRLTAPPSSKYIICCII